MLNQDLWAAYVSEPLGAALAPLLAAARQQHNSELVEELERLFNRTKNWRVAQHLAMILIGKFEGLDEAQDELKALYYAITAQRMSKDDPRASLVLGRVNWQRRLPLAVLHDVDTARANVAGLEESVVPSVLGEADLLEGLARSYLVDPRALDSLRSAEARHMLSAEALIQMLVAFEPRWQDWPEHGIWAGERLVPLLPQLRLGGRASHMHRRALQRKLLGLIRGHVDG